MSHQKHHSTAMARIVEYLRHMSEDMGGSESASGEDGKKSHQRQRYSRVPSRPLLSGSTTNTSLATTCGSQATLAANAYFARRDRDDRDDRDDPEAGADSSDDDERSPLDFPHRPITIKELNIKTFGIHSMASNKSQNGSINGDSPYKPTTQKLYLVTQVFATLAVSIGALVVGYASAYTSPALMTMTSENSTLLITKQEASWVGGLMPLAALGGGIVGGPMIEVIGRKKTLIAIAVPFIVSWLLIANAIAVWMLLLGRAICGFCVGVGSLTFPVYLGETLQPEVRGALGIVPTCLGNVGILLCFIAGKYLDWSGLGYLGAALPISFLVLTLWIPETPSWYVSKGERENAKQSLQWLRGKDADIDQELNELIDAERDSSQDKATFKEIIVNPKYIRAVLIALGLMFFQQMSGINAVIFYTVQIFRDAGSESMDENTSTIVIGVVNFASTFIASFMIDRLGRKVLLYLSSVAMIITLFILGIFFYVKSRMVDVSDYGWLPLVCFVVYVIGFSCGFGPIPWLMMGEILPVKIRGAAASLATGFNWACTFIVTKMFSDMILTIGTHGTFWTFGCMCVLGLFFVIFFVPETRGRTLEDIEKKLSGRREEPPTMKC